MKIRPKRYPKVERKYGSILGIKVSITSRERLLKDIETKLDNKEKYFLVTPNPENLLIATKDWLLKKAIDRAEFSVPDGIGLAAAHKYLEFKDNTKDPFRIFRLIYQGLFVGGKILTDKEYLTKDLEIIKGRELFFDIIEMANKKKLNVYFFGGEHGESQKAIEVLKLKYPNIVFKTNHQFPMYNKNCKPVTLSDRKLHKLIVGSIKLFEPDLIFVALNTPKQEKWIFRNLYRTRAIGAFAFGGTFNFVSGEAKLPPKWMTDSGLEWLFRMFTEPRKEKRLARIRRIFIATVIFPLKVFLWKLDPPRREKPAVKN